MHQSLQKGCLVLLVNSFSQTEGICRELLDLSKEKVEEKRGNN